MKTRSHLADLMERKKAERGRERRNEREGTYNDYLWLLDYVPVLGELQAFVGVLISRVCNQRNPFCCGAQPRPSPPSHQSSECLDPATTNTVCHNFCAVCVYTVTVITTSSSHDAQSIPTAINFKPWINKFCCTFCGRGVEEDKPTSSLLCSVKSKGPQSFFVFIWGHWMWQRGGHLFNLPHKHLQSGAGGTKVNPDPPLIDQTPGGFGWLVGFTPGSVWSQSGSAVNPQCCGPPGPHRLRTICCRVSAPVKRCTEQRWLPQIRSGGSPAALSVAHTTQHTKQFRSLAVFAYKRAVNAHACVWACDTQFWCLYSPSQEV